MPLSLSSPAVARSSPSAPASGATLSCAPLARRATETGGARRLWLPFHLVLLAVVATAVLLIARGNLPDPDLWWHLRDGQAIVAQQHLPRVDTYSFTVRQHPWMDHEWLAEAIFYLAYRWGGLEGVEFLMLVLLEVICLGMTGLAYWRTRNIKAAAVTGVICVALASVNFGPRTILLGYLCLLVLLLLLQGWRAGKTGMLYAVPGLFCLWINLHGSWALGLLVLAGFIAAGFWEGDWGLVWARRWSGPQLRALGATLACSVAALFINPWGWRLVLYPLDLAFHQPLNTQHVQEWMPVDFHSPRGRLLLLLGAVWLLSTLLRKRRWELGELGLSGFALFCGLSYERFLFFFALLAAPGIAVVLDFLPAYDRQRDRGWVNGVFVVGLGVLACWYYPGRQELRKEVAAHFPQASLNELGSQSLQGNLLNYYEWGGYVGWKQPRIPVFIDSRVDIFEYAGVLRDYLSLLQLKDVSGVLRSYGIDYVLFPPGQPLTRYLMADREWEVVCWGKHAVLLRRRTFVKAAQPRLRVGEAW